MKRSVFIKLLTAILIVSLTIPVLSSCALMKDKLKYEVNPDGVTCTIVGWQVLHSEDFVIPETLDGYTVSVIGESAFASRDFTSISIPSTVVEIQEEAFANNHYAVSVTFAENSQLKTIGESAFRWCESLESITLPNGVTEIRDGAFGNCEKLASISLPNSLTTLGGAFWGCSALTEVTFEEGSRLESIGTAAFSECSSLKSFTVPDSVKYIGDRAFASSGVEAIYFENTQGWIFEATNENLPPKNMFDLSNPQTNATILSDDNPYSDYYDYIMKKK